MPTRCAAGKEALSCQTITGTVFDVALSQQLLPGCRSLRTSGRLWETAVRKLPAVLEEKKLATGVLKTFDKAFACTWLDASTAVFGTKDDKVVLLDVDRLRVQKVVTLPPNSQPDSDDSLEITVQCGIRCLEQNAGGDLLVAAGCGPNDAAILSLPECQPLLRLQGHTDWVFGASWITDRVLVTGSRDKSLKLWDVTEQPGCEPSPITASATERHPQARQHRGKVRGVKWCPAREEVASVSTDAVLCLWDGELQLRRTVPLPESDEISCLATDGGQLYAVGTSNAVHVVDARAARPAVAGTSLQHHMGNRSLQFRHGLLSVGSGASEVWFFDLRAGAYLPAAKQCSNAGTERPPAPASAEQWAARRAPRLRMSEGWLHKNQIYRDYFEDVEVHTAAYAHEWDPGMSRMLVVGGPLASGLTGSYVGLWR